MAGRANVKNEKRRYEALKDKGMSKQRAARIANSPGAMKRVGQQFGSGRNSSQGGTRLRTGGPIARAVGRREVLTSAHAEANE
jgi:hypothetical protein